MGLLVLCGPQVYVGISLYFLGTLLLLIQHYRKKAESGKYQQHEAGPDIGAMEVLSEMSVTPMLRIFDRKKAEEFYINWLGFKIEWEHRFDETAPVYMEVSKARIKLHLTEHHGDYTPGGKFYIVCKGLQEYHKQLIDKNYPYNRPGLDMATWGSPCITVIDPFGNQLLFTESNDSSN
ncbi:MAG TPA: glyoxalase superfamily protein [Bacteroidia bacterium]